MSTMPFSRRTSRNAIGDLSGVGGVRVWGGGGGGGGRGGEGGGGGGGDLIPGGGGGGGVAGLRGVAAFAPGCLCWRCVATGFDWAAPGSFGSDGTGDRGFAPIRPGVASPSFATRSARAVPPDEGIGRAGAARPAAVRGARADVRGGCPLRGRVRGSEPLHLGVHVPPPRAARVGSAALVSGSASSVGAVSVEPSRRRGDLAARRAPRAPDRRNGSRGDTPNRDDGDRARARAAMTRAARLAHMPPRAPAPTVARSPAATLRCVNAPALAVDVLAVNIDHATESMCATLSVRARARFVPARSRECLGASRCGRCCAGKPREPAARVRSHDDGSKSGEISPVELATPAGRATAEP